jgi:hypothetical protein
MLGVEFALRCRHLFLGVPGDRRILPGEAPRSAAGDRNRQRQTCQAFFSRSGIRFFLHIHGFPPRMVFFGKKELPRPILKC